MTGQCDKSRPLPESLMVAIKRVSDKVMDASLVESDLINLCHLALAHRSSAPSSTREIDCPGCKGSGEILGMTQGRGPDDYGVPMDCPKCKGTGSVVSATLVSDGVMEPCVQAFDAYNDGRIDADECVCLMATALQIVLRRADDTAEAK